VLIYGDDAKDVWPQGTSRDGRYLLLSIGDYRGLTNVDLWILPLSGKQKPFPFLLDRFFKDNPSFSPDGKWIAYASTESGREEIYVAPFDGVGSPTAAAQNEGGNARGGPKWQASTAGGNQPRWRADGKELFYVSADNSVTAVEVNARDKTLELGTPQALFRVSPRPLAHSFDVSHDGKRFLVNSLGSAGTEPLSLVSDWTSQLKK
jgi:Tol biopolymer transport system component